MAAFIAKQMVGNQLSAVKGAVGGDGGDDGDDKEKAEEEERERQEAIREAEERRKEKHRKMEEEREKMRQDIRDKYNIKKKEEIVEAAPQEEPNPLMRKKKTPEELAAEAEQEELDDFTTGTTRDLPTQAAVRLSHKIKDMVDMVKKLVPNEKNSLELKNQIETQVNELKTQIEGKCVMQ